MSGFFPPQFTHTWENSACTKEAENQVFATAAGAEGSCPSANTQGWGEESPVSGRCCWAGTQNKSWPLLAPCCWRSWSSSAFGQTTSQGQGQESTRLLASSAGGQVEFSLTSYPCHLCLSLKINFIALNPQTEQRELVLFKGNIKSL